VTAPTRQAACSCGQLRVETTGEPFEVAMCHCLACQRRTGSLFGIQAGFEADQVQVTGRTTEYARISDEADRKEHVFHFCPDCGATVFCTEPVEPDLVAVMGGAFADPGFPPPTVSSYALRRHQWFSLPDTIERDDEAWAPLAELYDAGDYEAVADRAGAVIAAHPDNAALLSHVACCESLAGRAADAIDHLRIAIGLDEEFREAAAEDSDLDPLRDEPAFRYLLG
jgi:hypothetical protein